MWNVNMMDDFSKQWEKMMKEWFDQLMANPQFLEKVGQSMDSALNSKTVMDEVNRKIAKSLSLPTADTVARIGQYVIRQEAKINDLEDLIFEQRELIQGLYEKIDSQCSASSKTKTTATKPAPKKTTAKKSSAKKALASKSTVKKAVKKKAPAKKAGGKKK